MRARTGDHPGGRCGVDEADVCEVGDDGIGDHPGEVDAEGQPAPQGSSRRDPYPRLPVEGGG